MCVIFTIVIFLTAFGLIFKVLLKHYDQIESPMIVLATFLSIAIGITFFIILERGYTIYTGTGDIDMNATGQVGDFIGGTIGTILTAISIILLYKTLQEQRKSFNKSQIESRFFELLKFHRDNVNEIEFIDSEYKKQPTVAKGRHFFVNSTKQLDLAFEEFDFFVKSNTNYSVNEIYEEKYLSDLKRNDIIAQRSFGDFYLLAKIDICYLILFFGVSKNGRDEIIEKVNGKYNLDFMEDLVEYFRLKPSKSSKHYSMWQKMYSGKTLLTEIETMRRDREAQLKSGTPYSVSNNDFYTSDYNKFYGGHQFRLGHYFRHLYQIVHFVHYNKDLDERAKKNYIRILRGQLSDYEQKIFFYNSLSQLGRVWELSDASNQPLKNENRLISNYGIIKSIAKSTLVNGLKPEQVYPVKK